MPALAALYTGAENVPAISEAEQAARLSRADRDARVRSGRLRRFRLPSRRRARSCAVPERPAPRESQRAGVVRRRARRDPTAGSCGCARLLDAYDAESTARRRSSTARAIPPGRRSSASPPRRAEDAGAKAGDLPDLELEGATPGGAPRPVARERGRAAAVRTTFKPVKASYRPRFEFRGKLKPGYYVFAVRLTADMNPSRSQTFVSPTLPRRQAVATKHDP